MYRSFFFFKQKTAYEMRISDWSSDVCSSDLRLPGEARVRIVDERAGEDRREIDARDTGTTADEALQAIVVAEVEHAVDHEAQGVRIAVQRRRADKRARAIGLRGNPRRNEARSEEHTSELQSLMRTSYAVFCLKKKNKGQIKNKLRQVTTK